MADVVPAMERSKATRGKGGEVMRSAICRQVLRRPLLHVLPTEGEHCSYNKKCSSCGCCFCRRGPCAESMGLTWGHGGAPAPWLSPFCASPAVAS